VPIFQNDHWSLVAIDMLNFKIIYMDSLFDRDKPKTDLIIQSNTIRRTNVIII